MIISLLVINSIMLDAVTMTLMVQKQTIHAEANAIVLSMTSMVGLLGVIALRILAVIIALIAWLYFRRNLKYIWPMADGVVYESWLFVSVWGMLGAITNLRTM